MKQHSKHDSYYYADKAEKSGMKVDFDCHGHPIIDAPDGSSMMLPANLKSTHMECIIRKWLIRIGVLLILVALVYFL